MQRIRPKRIALRSALLATVKAGPSSYQGILIDISRRGLSIRLGHPLLPGTAVEVHRREVVLLGQVRHCNSNRGGHLVGIQIQHSLEHLEAMRAWNSLIQEVSMGRG